MSEEKRVLIVETVKNLRQMDKESLYGGGTYE